MRPHQSDTTRALGLSAVLGTAGVMHFVRPQFFDEIVPHRLPLPPRVWTYVSGVAELACAVAVARPSTRRVGALASAAVFVAVFPANIQMAIDWRSRPASDRAAAYGRLPMQVPLVFWALRVQRDTACREERRMSWERVTVADLQPGDHVRHALREFEVARIQSPFLGQTALVCLIEDAPDRWCAYPVGTTMEIEVLRA